MPPALEVREEAPSREADLEGSLAEFGLSDLLQLLATSSKSGTVTFREGAWSAQVELLGGDIVAGSFGVLDGQEALLAMIDRFARGRFRFQAAQPAIDRPPTAARALNISSVLIYSAWLEDELSRRRHLLPEEDDPLFLKEKLVAVDGVDLAAVPLREVQSWIELFPGTTLGDLVRRNFAAASRVRLAVSWLIEKQALATRPLAVATGPRG